MEKYIKLSDVEELLRKQRELCSHALTADIPKGPTHNLVLNAPLVPLPEFEFETVYVPCDEPVSGSVWFPPQNRWLCPVQLPQGVTVDDEVKIIFKNPQGQKEEMIITVDKLLESTKDDLYELLEETHPCTSASCNNESQNFCDCGGVYEDYIIDKVVFSTNKGGKG